MKTTQTVTKTTYTFSEDDIIAALVKTGQLPGGIPITECFVRVPGGGDWSNTKLDLGGNPVVIKTEEVQSS